MLLPGQCASTPTRAASAATTWAWARCERCRLAWAPPVCPRCWWRRCRAASTAPWMRGKSTTWSRRAAARSASQVSCQSALEGLHQRLVPSLVRVCVILTGLCHRSAWSRSVSNSQVCVTDQPGQGLCRTNRSVSDQPGQGLCHRSAWSGSVSYRSVMLRSVSYRSVLSRSESHSQVSLVKVCVTGHPSQSLFTGHPGQSLCHRSNLVMVCVTGQPGQGLCHRSSQSKSVHRSSWSRSVSGQPNQSLCHRSSWSRSMSQVSLVKVCVTGHPGQGLCHRSAWSRSMSQVSLVKVCVTDQSVLAEVSVTCLPSYSPGLQLIKKFWKHSMPVFSVNWFYLLSCNFHKAEEWTLFSGKASSPMASLHNHDQSSLPCSVWH